MAWTQAIAELLPEEVVAIDGKTARRSHDCAGGKGAMHLVSAWATQNTLTLGQVRTAEKLEITAIPQLLDLLDLQGCIVTIDAMGCQREIAQQIVDGGADYVLAVKENQGQLHEGIRDLFEGAEALGFDGVPYDYSQTVNKGHGRVERRECWAITETDCLDYINPHGQWPQLKAAIKVVGHRETAAGAISQPRYYSGGPSRTTAGCRQEPLEELTALDFGCNLSRRPVPCARPTDHRTWPRCVRSPTTC